MTDIIVPPGAVNVAPRHLSFNAPITIDEAEGFALALAARAQDTKWWTGDLMMYAQSAWGEYAYQIVPEGEGENYMRYARLSGMYLPHERVYDCKWSVYWHLRSHPDRDEWLQRAETNHWTVAQLKAAMQGDDIIRRETPLQRLERALSGVERAVRLLDDGDSAAAADVLREVLS